jgi:hypothetical protein
MERIMKNVCFVIAIVLFFLFFSQSYALDFYANGTYRIRSFNTWGGGGNDYGPGFWHFGEKYDHKDHDQYFDQRFDLKLTADNNDGIKGVVMLEMGDAIWGDKNHYGRLGGGDGGSEIEEFNAYIEIDKWIYTKAGVFTFDSPNSAILSEELAGILVGKDFGKFAINLLYSKLYDGGSDVRGFDNNDDANLWGVMVPVKTHYFNMTPYFLYSHIENKGRLTISPGNYGNLRDVYNGYIYRSLNVDDSFSLLGRNFTKDSFHSNYEDTDAWWVGAIFEGNIPIGSGLIWNLQGVYGNADINSKNGNGDLKMEGFLIDGSLTYVFDKFKFDLYGLFSNGFDEDDYKHHDLKIMPTIAPDYMAYKTYAPFFFDSLSMGEFACDPSGYSMIGGQVTFNSLEKLKHIFDVAHIWNMIDKDVAKLEPDIFRYRYDSFQEVALISEYQIAEGTTISLLLGCLNPDALRNNNGKKFAEDTVYAANFLFKYMF